MRKASFWLAAVVLAGTLQAENFERLSTDVLAARTSESISPSGRFVALANVRRGVELVDSTTQRRISLEKPGLGLPEFSWSGNGAYVVVCNDKSFSVFQAWDGKRLYEKQGRLAEISPDGLKTAFVRDHNLWMAATATGDVKQLTDDGNSNLLVGEPDPIYGYEFAVCRHYWWSPDSTSLLYLETQFESSDHYVLPGRRLPAFRLKKLDLKSGKSKLITESSDKWPYLLRVSWHPDSQRILFYRMNRPQTSAELCIFDSGSVRTVETETDAYWVNVPETPLVVGGGDQVILSSERTGSRHVYLYSLGGALVRDLTPKDLEVYHLHRAFGSNGEIYVSGTTGNYQELQLFELSLSGGDARQVTSEAGWHQVKLSLHGETFLDVFSTTMTPPILEWKQGSVKRFVIFRDKSTQKSALNEFLEIRTHDNISLPARLYKPEDFNPQKKYPVILYTYSGPGGHVVKDWWGGWEMAWNREMVCKGYLVLAVDVRGSGGYGHWFEEYIHYRFGAQEVADLREVVSYLRRMPYVDRTRLGIWGCDYGAQTVVHAMLQFPGGFKAGFADSPVVQWSDYDAYFTERYLGLPANHIAEYDDSTALDDARRMTGTLMVLSSDGNPLIRSGQAEALAEAMKRVKKNKSVMERLHLVEESDSNYRNDASGLMKLLQQMSAFFTSAL